MIRILAVVAAMAAAQPVSATVMMNITQTAAAMQRTGNAAAAPAPPMQGPENGIRAIGSGPIVAGITGVLALVLMFGRRKSGLPEVVS